MAGQQYDQQVASYGSAIREANQGMSNALGTVAGLGMQGAIAGIGSGTTYDPSKFKLTPIV
jgi:hypothetical protein